MMEDIKQCVSHIAGVRAYGRGAAVFFTVSEFLRSESENPPDPGVGLFSHCPRCGGLIDYGFAVPAGWWARFE